MSFAAQRRESYCSSGMKVANGASAADFLGKDHFPFKIPLGKCFKLVLSRMRSEGLLFPECVAKGSRFPLGVSGWTHVVRERPS